MTAMRIDLESGSRHYLTFEAAPGGPLRVGLHHSSAGRRSSLHAAFRRHLCVESGSSESIFPETDEFALAPVPRRVRVILGRENPVVLAEIHWGDDEPVVEPSTRYVLSPFESRYLADNGVPHPAIRGTGVVTRLTTDLHVHFAGCARPADLVRIGVEGDVPYPAAFLAEAGIRLGGDADVPLSEVPPVFLRQLEAKLSIPLDRQVTFLEMERIYRLRSPITKHPSTLIPLCRQIAADYATMGVTYAELSLSNVLEANRLRAIHHQLPAIEQATGVRLRFLAALNRHDDYEWDLDCIDRIESLAASRYLVGVDFMGHETNSTRSFAPQLGELARRMGAVRPGFVVRVHAGENPAHPENVRIAMEAVTGSGVQFRVGHGLYGVDDATLDRLRDGGAIVEFNLNSNFALNNIQNSLGAPICRYVERGVPVVLGTDGYGIYQSTLGMEARAAMLCGLDGTGFAQLRGAEQDYLHRRETADAALPAAGAFVIPDDPPPVRYTPAVLACKAEAARLRDEILLARLKAIGVPLIERSGLATLLRGRRCVSFAGAWNRSWDAISPANQALVRQEIGLLLAALSPADTVLVTGGTKLGVEGVVQTAARRLGFTVLAALVSQTPPESLEAGGVTHAYLVGQSLYDKAAGLYGLMKDCDGLCLFVGGGSIVNDEIQTAGNLRLRYLLMDGPEGASTEQSRQQPDRAFRTAADVLRVLGDAPAWSSTNEPYWHLGANPTVDIVLTRSDPSTARRQVLLIRRDVDAPSEGGKWALPGGFQLTHAPRGTPWQRDLESAREACARECLEETGLDVRPFAERFIPVGEYQGGGRDPRDTPQAWSRSEVFALHLPDVLAGAPLCGADDACDARWFDVFDLPPDLAFDHARILADGLARLTAAAQGGHPS